MIKIEIIDTYTGEVYTSTVESMEDVAILNMNPFLSIDILDKTWKIDLDLYI